ncbi:carbohydrate kinase family protein [Candidatus Uhrbacteria bacterium]|nr:carbohydrate kinase family protein [Candidatus Uhrbacteria bacterium]
MDIITIGSATRDVFVKSEAFEVHESAHSPSGFEGCFPLGAKIDIDEVNFETGGGATNSAVTFARLGHSVGIVARVGQDANGDEIIRVLAAEGVDTGLIQRDPKEQTAYSMIAVAGSGERTVLVYRGASKELDHEDIPWNRLKPKWFYVTSLGGDLALMRRIVDHAVAVGAKIAWNPGSAEIKRGLSVLKGLIKSVDVFNLNREEAAVLVGVESDQLDYVIRQLCDLPHMAAVITDGPNGAFACGQKTSLFANVLDVPRVNVTGAGDAFGSGLIAGLLKKDDLDFALRVAVWNATGVVQQMGAKKGLLRKYPSPAQLKKVRVGEFHP